MPSRRPRMERRSFRIRPGEWAVVEAAAALRDEYPTAYVRKAVLRRAREDLARDPEPADR